MNTAHKVATWDVLRSLGFQLDATVISDQNPGLSFDFGNFKLSACSVKNKWFADIVLFTGILPTRRTLTQLDFEIPRFVESKEQCAAYIAWFLDRSADGGTFQPAKETDWLPLGRTQKRLLPWEREREAREKDDEKYRTRPQCTVQREWLKLALKSLAHSLSQSAETDFVQITFDGEVLRFQLAKNLIVLPAEGSPWRSCFALPAGKLISLPKRLMAESINVSVWQCQLYIDRSKYDGVTKTTFESAEADELPSVTKPD